MNIGQTVYSTIVRYAEGGARVTKVVLPKALHEEWVEEGHNINSLFAKLGVEVVEGEVTEPKFHLGERIE
jgi:hypothetical protein